MARGKLADNRPQQYFIPDQSDMKFRLLHGK